MVGSRIRIIEEGETLQKKVQLIASSIFEKPNQNMKVVHNSSATKEDIQLGKFFANKLAIIKMMTREREERRPHQIDTPIQGRQLFCQTLVGCKNATSILGSNRLGKQ